MGFGISANSRVMASKAIGTIKKIVLEAVLASNVATFDKPIPSDYEMYVNGQWHDKGQLEEIQIDAFSLQIPNWDFEIDESVHLKYYILT